MSAHSTEDKWGVSEYITNDLDAVAEAHVIRTMIERVPDGYEWHEIKRSRPNLPTMTLVVSEGSQLLEVGYSVGQEVQVPTPTMLLLVAYRRRE